MKIDYQRLRNLTTSRLHTDIGCIYEDLEAITGQIGLMTHMLPRVMQAVKPWLLSKVAEKRFWDGEFDQSHVGIYQLPEPTEIERKQMLQRYFDQPDLLAGKEVIAVKVDD